MADVPPSPFDRFIERIWAMGGTDLLLLAGSPPAVRIDHVLRPLDGEPPLAAADVYRWVATVVGEEQAGAYRRDLEIDFSLGWRGRVRLRANAYHQRGLPAVALRFIPERIPTPDELGLPHPVRDWARMPQGLVLVTGPAGSGKSTTTASLIDQINRERACHIVTIEDPIEYVHLNGRSYVSQREVGADTHSFERALRSALREDPDVLLVGEMRDPESIAITLTIAETGHLVFSTLHTNDAAQAVDRIVDAFPGERQAQVRLQLASSLLGIVAQRLLPRNGGGLVAAFEVLVANQAVRNLIREGKTRQLRNVIVAGRGEGMQTLELSLSWLVQHGYATYEDAVAKAVLPAEVGLG